MYLSVIDIGIPGQLGTKTNKVLHPINPQAFSSTFFSSIIDTLFVKVFYASEPGTILFFYFQLNTRVLKHLLIWDKCSLFYTYQKKTLCLLSEKNTRFFFNPFFVENDPLKRNQHNTTRNPFHHPNNQCVGLSIEWDNWISKIFTKNPFIHASAHITRIITMHSSLSQLKSQRPEEELSLAIIMEKEEEQIAHEN